MEICKIEIAKKTLQLLVDSDALKTSDFKVIGVNEVNHNLQDNAIWQAAKKKADKAYKDFKEVEFKLIHKIE